MRNATKAKSLRKGSNCPTCSAGKLIPIVYGFPGRELMEQSDRGEIELGGCVVTQIIDHNGIRTNDPELQCPTYSSNFYRSGVKDTVPQEIAEQLKEWWSQGLGEQSPKFSD